MKEKENHFSRIFDPLFTRTGDRPFEKRGSSSRNRIEKWKIARWGMRWQCINKIRKVRGGDRRGGGGERERGENGPLLC